MDLAASCGNATVRLGSVPGQLSTFCEDVMSAVRASIDGRRLRKLDRNWGSQDLQLYQFYKVPSPLPDWFQSKPRLSAKRARISKTASAIAEHLVSSEKSAAPKTNSTIT